MISNVLWLPSNVFKRIPDFTSHIPLENLPVAVDTHMLVEDDDFEKFLNEKEKETYHKFLEEDSDIDTSKKKSSKSSSQRTKVKKEKEEKKEGKEKKKEKEKKKGEENKKNEKNDNSENDENENENDENDKNDENDENDENNKNNENNENDENAENNENDKDTKKFIEGTDSEPNEDESDGDDPNAGSKWKREDYATEEEYLDAVMAGYDDEPGLDFLSRLGGLDSSVGIGPVDSADLSTMMQRKIRRREKKEAKKKDKAIKAAESDKKKLQKKKKKKKDDIDQDSELSDLEIREYDEMFVLCGSDEAQEVYTCEINVFDTKLRTYYTHHDIILTAFPLNCCWLNFTPMQSGKDTGNYLAVSTVEEAIEIFNLDIVDNVAPVAVLGGREKKPQKSKKKDSDFDMESTEKRKDLKQKNNNEEEEDDDDDIDMEMGSEIDDDLMEEEVKEYYDMNPSIRFNMTIEDRELLYGELRPNSHEDSVLCLDWHEKMSQYLMSGGADGHIKQWDLTTGECLRTWSNGTYHSDKIQCMKIHPIEWNMLLTGSNDKTIRLSDIRQKSGAKSWGWFQKEVECIQWYPRNPAVFVAGLEDGRLIFVDSRKEDKPVLEFQAHSNALTSLTFNRQNPDIFATVSLDNMIKLWHHPKLHSQDPPTLLQEMPGNIGSIFSCDFSPQSKYPWLLLVGGQTTMGLWDITTSDAVKNIFGSHSAFEQELKKIDVTKHTILEK